MKKEFCDCCNKLLTKTDYLPDGEEIDAIFYVPSARKTVLALFCIECAASNPHLLCGCTDNKLIDALGMPCWEFNAFVDQLWRFDNSAVYAKLTKQ